MSSYLSNFGNALEQYEARKSPLTAALYQTITGKSPYGQFVPQGGQQPGQTTGPQTPQPGAMPGRYKQGGVDPSLIANPYVPLDMNPAKQPVPLNPDAGTVDSALVDNSGSSPTVVFSGSNGPAPGNGVYQPGFPNDPSLGGDYPTTGDSGPSGGGGGTPVLIDPNSPTGVYQGGGGTDPGTGDGDVTDQGSLALGGVAGRPQINRIAESGPEMAGGRIVTNPSIVKLDKGDSVIPLTPRAGNKLQPDLLEGHLAAPRPQGVQYSRYKSYGQGRGLMR